MTTHIQVLGRNHRHYLEACLRSCFQQTVSVPVVYIDNDSTDGSVEFVREKFPAVRIVAHTKNRGYSGGHNDGLQALPESDIVVVLNPDVVLKPDFVERGSRYFTSSRVGAVAPLLLRLGEQVVDAYGDVLLPTLRAVNQGAGQSLADFERRQSSNTPWGFTGAAAFLRRRALHDVALNGEVFDEDLFAYREDVDLSWRLRLRGWDIVGAPDARATHVRAARGDAQKDSFVAQLSWRNYLLVLVKDVPTSTLWRHAPGLLMEGLARDVQMLCSPKLWPALPELLRLLPRFIRKRSQVLGRASATLYASGDRRRDVGRFPDGRLNYEHAAVAPVLSCVVKRGADILLLKRSELVGTYRGRWHIIGGYLDEPGKSASEKALEELEEEVGIPRAAVRVVRTAEPFELFDPDVAKTWQVHSVLLEVDGNPPVKLDWEHTDFTWVRLDEISRYHLIPSVSDVLQRLLSSPS